MTLEEYKEKFCTECPNNKSCCYLEVELIDEQIKICMNQNDKKKKKRKRIYR